MNCHFVNNEHKIMAHVICNISWAHWVPSNREQALASGKLVCVKRVKGCLNKQAAFFFFLLSAIMIVKNICTCQDVKGNIDAETNVITLTSHVTFRNYI